MKINSHLNILKRFWCQFLYLNKTFQATMHFDLKTFPLFGHLTDTHVKNDSSWFSWHNIYVKLAYITSVGCN